VTCLSVRKFSDTQLCSILSFIFDKLLRIGCSRTVMEPVVMLQVCILPHLFHKHGVRVDSSGSCTATVTYTDMLTAVLRTGTAWY